MNNRFIITSLMASLTGCGGSASGPATSPTPTATPAVPSTPTPTPTQTQTPIPAPAPAPAPAPPADPTPPPIADTSLSDFERTLVNLPANSWFEVPNTRMLDQCAAETFGVHATGGCAAVVFAWSGGAYDSRHRKLLVWGGGHNDYWGNEIYGFDLRQGRWERLTDPSPGRLIASADPLADGRPNSRHTYDGVQYIEQADRLFARGGSMSSNGYETTVTWLFDPDRLQWNAASFTAGPRGSLGYSSGYDPASGLVLMRTHNALWSYAYATNTWTQVADLSRNEKWQAKRGAVDTRRQLFWSIGSTDFLVWSIAAGKQVTDDWAAPGAEDIVNATAPGFDYDSKADQFVAWKGGPVHVLDLATKTWNVKSGIGAPPAQTENGTYGRWRYLARYNVFILVNGASSNVVFYKNTAGGA